MKKRVAIAMSGGVDSSVAAALLLRQGYDVFGIFAKTWTPQPGDGTTCTTVADRRDALRVAAQLGIPLFTVDLEQDYRDQVVEPLFAGYAAGETPNPDVLCNRVVKFGGLWRFAQSQGAEFLATGHYARIEDSGNPKSQIPNPKLLRGIDSNKDQSYFLWDIPREVLPQVLFPIGNYQKDKVRQLAHEFALPVADKKDSQGICFLGQTNLVTFLEQRIKARPGMIRDWLTGCVLGRHQGIHNYTIGQRHGLGSLAITPESQPLYVVALEKKSVVFTCRAPEMGDSEIAMEVDYKGEPMEIGFNPQFLIDVLKVIREDSFELHLGQSDRPGLIKSGSNYIYIVMPVSLT